MNVVGRRVDVAAGGGAFVLPRLALGIFLVPQPTHRIALSSDRRLHIPLERDEGWILPAEATGLCEFDAAHSYLFFDFADDVMDEVGFDRHAGFKPVFGRLDPLLVQLSHHVGLELQGVSGLYRDTMHLALAAYLSRIVGGRRALPAAVDDRRLVRAADYVRDNLTGDVSLERLASEAAMSRYHFVRAFKAGFGRAPHQYVIAQRMERAKLLLRTTRLPVVEVALELGYDDVSRFTRHFRRHAGTTPAAFRSR